MTDTIRVNKTSIAGPAVAGDATPAVKTSKKASAVAPQAPVAGLAAAASRPQPMAMDESQSTTHMGGALKILSGAAAFGPQFKFINMSEAKAVAAVHTAMAALKSRLAFAPTKHGFAPALATTDELGKTHVRMNRLYDGIPVFGEQVISHLDASGKVADFTGNTLPAQLLVDTKPTQSAESALATARACFSGKAEQIGGPTLLIAKTDDGVYHLAHHVTVATYGDARAPRKMHYFVDAHSGDVLPLTFNEHGGFIPDFRLQGAREKAATQGKAFTGSVVEGTGNSIYLGNVSLSTTEENGKFLLRDPQANNAETRDARNGSGGTGSSNVVLTDNNNKWGETSDDMRQRAGIDAQFGAVQFLKFLKDFFGRDSLDGRGMRLLSNVHVRSNYVNAYWDGSTMNYGDGDGRTAGPLVDKDVASHEPMHGLTQAANGLVYRGESGALNEAASDILGSAGFSWFLRGMKDTGIETDFLIGEDCWTPATPGDALRYMNDPMRDREQRSGDLYSRDNYKSRYTGSGDNGGVHLNSGIANNFFYLLSQGGTNRTSQMKVEKGIGMEKALKIYYRAHTVYTTASTNFAQAREGWIKAATDLYGADSVETKTVIQACNAVGIEARPRADFALVA